MNQNKPETQQAYREGLAALVEAALENGALNAEDLAKAIGYCEVTVRNGLGALRKRREVAGKKIGHTMYYALREEDIARVNPAEVAHKRRMSEAERFQFIYEVDMLRRRNDTARLAELREQYKGTPFAAVLR